MWEVVAAWLLWPVESTNHGALEGIQSTMRSREPGIAAGIQHGATEASQFCQIFLGKPRLPAVILTASFAELFVHLE